MAAVGARAGTANPWDALDDGSSGGRGRGGRGSGGRGRGGRGKGRDVRKGQSQQGQGMISGSGSDAIAAFKAARGDVQGGAQAAPVQQDGGEDRNANQEKGMLEAELSAGSQKAKDWVTYNNRSNSQKMRKQEGQRTVTVADAIANLEQKAREIHESNISLRIATWGQWCRRMEDPRLDQDTIYIDEANGRRHSNFSEIFIRSSALELAVRSVVLFPLSDDTELVYLLSHCLEGTPSSHAKIARGLNALGETFRLLLQPVAVDALEPLLRAFSTLKVNPRLAHRESSTSLRRIDEQIAFNIAKAFELSKEGAAGGAAAQQQCTSELIKLASEKMSIYEAALSSSSLGDDAGNSGDCGGASLVAARFDEMGSVIEAMITEVQQAHQGNERKVKELESRLQSAMMGDDEEHKRVVKEQQELSNQVAALRERRALLLRELESVDSEIETAEHRQKSHAAQSARVIANYERKMKAMSNGGDSKIKSAYEATRKTLEGCKGSKDFLEWLKGESATCLSERDGKVQSDLLQTRRQLVGFVRQHLDLLLESLELVSRRSKFCESKLASMRDELAEAIEIGLTDLAGDLSANIAKFESMQVDIMKGFGGGDNCIDIASLTALVESLQDSEGTEEVAHVKELLSAVARAIPPVSPTKSFQKETRPRGGKK